MVPTSHNALCCAFQRWIVIVLLLATFPLASVRTGAAGATFTATTVTALIADINTANTNPMQGPYTINLMPGSPYTLTTEATLNSGTGLPIIMSGVDLTIVGNGATIQRSTAGGTPDFRIFVNGSNATLRLNALAVRNGSVVGAGGKNGEQDVPGGNGSPAAGGAILNNGLLIVSGSTFASNHAVGGAGGNGGKGSSGSLARTGGRGGDAGNASAGAISNFGMLTITESTFSDNTALGGAGGMGGDGGDGSGSPGGPGGAAGTGGDATGGALSNSGTMTVTNSTFVGNTTIGGAGGNGGRPGGGSGTAPSGYGASGGAGQGGAIADAASGTLALTNSTLTTNSAVGGAGGMGAGGTVATASGSGGGLHTEGVGVTVTNTILAANPAFNDGNCGNSVSDGGYNLEFNPATTCGFTNSQTGNPMLSALANNGGPTQTIALRAGSAAINHGNATTCAGTAGGVDQRGLPRSAGQCSIGAFEPQAMPTLTAMSPTSGPIAGGSSVTLFGAGFLPGATVAFGPNPAVTVTVINPTTITVTTPAHLTAGIVSVAVTNPDLQATAAMPYTYGILSTSPAARSASALPGQSPRPLPAKRPPGASSGSGLPSPLPPHR